MPQSMHAEGILPHIQLLESQHVHKKRYRPRYRHKRRLGSCSLLCLARESFQRWRLTLNGKQCSALQGFRTPRGLQNESTCRCEPIHGEVQHGQAAVPSQTCSRRSESASTLLLVRRLGGCLALARAFEENVHGRLGSNQRSAVTIRQVELP